MYSLNFKLPPHFAADMSRMKLEAAEMLHIDARTISNIRIRKSSIDARQRNIVVHVTADVYLAGESVPEDYEHIEYRSVENAPQAIVVGAGPGGLFSALRLIELGIKPIVLERGKDVHSRKHDIAKIRETQKVDPESNYSFGEGGAGAYSDGKLYTRSRKRGNVDKILAIFCQHGADTDILSSAHPHLGTDRLPRIIENIRNTIIDCGGEVHFNAKVTQLLVNSENEVCGVVDADGREYQGPVVLATGHSARDVYRMLRAGGYTLEMKGIAAGVRLEHQSFTIDCIQYHSRNGRGNYLPAAEYSMTAQVAERGVYSFCMCPGGFVVPAATGEEQIVVNGMSPKNRGSKWSNSGMVVEIRPEDLDEVSMLSLMKTAMGDEKFGAMHDDFYDKANPLRMMYFQEALERECWLQGNRKQTAPAQRMGDFVNRKLSYDLPPSSYAPGLISSPLHFWMPLFMYARLGEAFRIFGSRYKGFLSKEATVIGVETRTSSPVRITRDNETLQHVSRPGLFPCGEGAGYAGGIVSAAIDGERCADAVASWIESHKNAVVKK